MLPRLGRMSRQSQSGDVAMSLKVLSAVYGALPNGSQVDAQGFIVTKAVQRLIDNLGGVVPINNANFNDPAVGFTKHFAAIVERNGVHHCFACQENQTINFNSGGGTSQE
jgi:hypothetical protein